MPPPTMQTVVGFGCGSGGTEEEEERRKKRTMRMNMYMGKQWLSNL